MAEDPHVDVGRLRWKVYLFDLVQTAETAGPGIDETLKAVATLSADIQWVAAATFWGPTQVDAPFTHRIFMRWHDYLPTTMAIVRFTAAPGGRYNRELYRVHRMKPLGGRMRFAVAECELRTLERPDLLS